MRLSGGRFGSVWMVFGLTVLCGCGTEKGRPDSPGQEESGEEQSVSGEAPLWVGDEPWSVSEGPSLTVGVLDGPDEYQFVNVVSGGRQSDGDLVVVDAAVQMVRMYSSDGTFLKILGGPGSGPGEFAAPGQVRISGDSVAVWDERLFRITWFDPSGELARVQSVDLGAISKAVQPPLYPAYVEPLSDGWLLVRLLEKSAKAPARGALGETSRPRSGALMVSADLSVLDTLMFFPDEEQIVVEAPWGPQAVNAPFGKQTSITHRKDPQAICVGDQEGPEVVCFGPEGEPEVLRWEEEPPPPTSREMDAWRNRVRRDFGMKVSEADLDRMLNAVPMPSTRPAYARILFDCLGNLWVEVGPSGDAEFDTIDHLVFDPEGVLLGRVAVPKVRVLEIGADYLLGVNQDDMEVEYVQVFDLVKPPVSGPPGDVS